MSPFKNMKIAEMQKKNEKNRKDREALRSRCTGIQKDYELTVEGVEAFLENFPVSSDGFGLISSGEVVKDADHLRGLLGTEPSITIEFCAVAQDQADDTTLSVSDWLTRFANSV